MASHSLVRWIVWVPLCAATLLPAQTSGEGPTDEKARKSYQQGVEYLRNNMTLAALERFKKADKQDGGRCVSCQKAMIKYGTELREWETAESAAREMVAEARGDQEMAIAHHRLGVVLLSQGLDREKEELFARAHDEMTLALAAYPRFPDAAFDDGRVLARLNRDDEAKAQFERFVAMNPENELNRRRALRYISQPQLARARMAPPFEVTTMEGRRVSLDDLQGKVVLLDFWATWCPPCREAVPHMKKIAEKFQGMPLVILSVSLDEDEGSWKEFTAKNGMTWLNCREGRFGGPLAKLFGVKAIPHTFTIDADGVLQDEHIGDARIESKLKKLVDQAMRPEEEKRPAQ